MKFPVDMPLSPKTVNFFFAAFTDRYYLSGWNICRDRSSNRGNFRINGLVGNEAAIQIQEIIKNVNFRTIIDLPLSLELSHC